jgi:hypothetical protein
MGILFAKFVNKNVERYWSTSCPTCMYSENRERIASFQPLVVSLENSYLSYIDCGNRPCLLALGLRAYIVSSKAEITVEFYFIGFSISISCSVRVSRGRG